MKDYQGFKNNGNWYKGNLHSHTTVSDGKMTPEQSVEVYKEHGYNFLALSEHEMCIRDRPGSGDVRPV